MRKVEGSGVLRSGKGHWVGWEAGGLDFWLFGKRRWYNGEWGCAGVRSPKKRYSVGLSSRLKAESHCPIPNLHFWVLREEEPGVGSTLRERGAEGSVLVQGWERGY